MTWWAFYDTESGRLLSVASDDNPANIPVTTPEGVTKVSLGASRPANDQMWDVAARAFVPRPAKVVIDRLQDFLAQPGVITVWNSLTTARKTTLQTALIVILGNARFRTQNEDIQIGAGS